jgi:hypothetical protein
MNRLVLALALSLGSMAAFAAEPVATLGSQQGTVLVNQDDVFVTANDAQALHAGDRVMVMEGGSAELVFADGCPLLLESGSILLVPAQSPCAGTVANVQRIGPSYAQVIGSDTDNWDAQEWAILVGVITIGILVGGDDTSDPPVSP